MTSNAPVGLFEYRESADGVVSFPFFNAQLPELLGVDGDAVRRNGDAAFTNLHPEDLARVQAGIAHSRQSLKTFKARYRLNHPTKGLLWLKASTKPVRHSDGATSWYGSLLDITSDVRRQAELTRAHRAAEEMRAINEQQALHDGLTEIPNRRYYDTVLNALFEASKTERGTELVIIRVDLDRFKHLNDSLGHEAGDLALKRVAKIISDNVGEDGFVARIGGDEFSIIYKEMKNHFFIDGLIYDIKKAVSEPFDFDGNVCRIGASFGVATTSDLASVGPDILLFADSALYKAKAEGRGRSAYFTPEMHETILADRQLTAEIQCAFERGEFVPFFQPQVCAQTEQIVGAEVLIRWRHPKRGVLAPGAFMHIAENLRIVPELDRVMMDQCLTHLSQWERAGRPLPKISFNVSMGHLTGGHIIEQADTLSQCGTKICFELLETILIEDETDIQKYRIREIRNRGISIEIDDFGAGHASIIGLMNVEPDTLKIDKRLIDPIVENGKALILVQSIIEMAKNMNITVIAEGVETYKQAAILQRLGCDILQGYLYSRPVDANAFSALLGVVPRAPGAGRKDLRAG